MRWLLNTGSDEDWEGFAGIMTAPYHSGPTPSIKRGAPWAGDNEKFTRGTFDPQRFFNWLERMEPYRNQCLFVTVPDEVGNALQTGALFKQWIWRFIDWPLAFVAQDGQENFPLPDPSTYSVLFIGGSTEWKMGMGAIECIKRGQELGKHIHIGRVNSRKRHAQFLMIEGSEHFTCDGNHHIYVGMKEAKRKWRKYQDETLTFKFW